MVTSSSTAYGAFPDNPVPIAEDWPVRGAPEFSYARDKADADRVCQLWAAEHPDRVMTIVRPCIVFGPNVDNYIVRSWENAPFFPVLDGVEAGVPARPRGRCRHALVGLLDKKADGRLQPRRRRHDDLARVRRAGRREGRARCRSRPRAGSGCDVDGCTSPRRGAAGQPATSCATRGSSRMRS